MSSIEVPRIRDAGEADVAAICAFGVAHVADHYRPLIGDAPARAQVERWWNEQVIGQAVRAGVVVVAEVVGVDGVVGVGQRGRDGTDHVIYKLYVHPDHRARGLGPRLIDALVRQLPDDADRLGVEHFAGNARAGAFYEREGFVVERIEPGPTAALAVVWRARRLGGARPRGAAEPAAPAHEINIS